MSTAIHEPQDATLEMTTIPFSPWDGLGSRGPEDGVILPGHPHEVDPEFPRSQPGFHPYPEKTTPSGVQSFWLPPFLPPSG